MNTQGQNAAKRERGEGGLIQVAGSKNWYVLWRDAYGKQHKESSGSENKMVAIALLRKRLSEKDAGKNPAPASRRVKYETVRELLLDNLEANGAKSLQTVAGKRSLWNLPPVDAFFKGIRVLSINEELIRKYRKHRRAQEANPSTINRELSLLRRMMFLAERLKVYAGDIPDFQMTNEDGAVRKGFLEHTDFEKLRAAMPENLHTLLIFLYSVAVRLGEAQSIQWKQVDLARKTIQLWDTKSGEPRTVPLVAELAARLSLVPVKKGPVFYQGQFRKTWSKACVKCGLGTWELDGEKKHYRGLIVHDLRRSAIRNMTLAGVPQNVIMSISGHRTISVFLRYNIVSPAQQHSAMQALDVWKKDDASLMQVEGETVGQKRLSS